MKVAVLRFPGSNCDQDAFHALRDDIGVDADYVWHQETSLAGYDAVFVPGGFSYGDYLRCGAVAANSPVMAEVARFAQEGRPVVGVCNGFQVLCEAQLLPGALLLNEKQKFECRPVWLTAVNRESIWTRDVDRPIEIPVAHGEGRFVCDDETLRRLEGENQVAFRYTDADGNVVQPANVNGSTASIAGVVNRAGNVLGMMPHPERATKKVLGGTDGLLILRAFHHVLEGTASR